jgi:hypothetical protein
VAAQQPVDAEHFVDMPFVQEQGYKIKKGKRTKLNSPEHEEIEKKQ